MESKFPSARHRKIRRSLTAWAFANTPAPCHARCSPASKNPCPVGERDVRALLPKRRAELGRKFVQHGLDGRIGEMTEVRVDRTTT